MQRSSHLRCLDCLPMQGPPLPTGAPGAGWGAEKRRRAPRLPPRALCFLRGHWPPPSPPLLHPGPCPAQPRWSGPVTRAGERRRRAPCGRPKRRRDGRCARRAIQSRGSASRDETAGDGNGLVSRDARHSHVTPPARPPLCPWRLSPHLVRPVTQEERGRGRRGSGRRDVVDVCLGERVVVGESEIRLVGPQQPLRHPPPRPPHPRRGPFARRRVSPRMRLRWRNAR